jgi:hypothetical protein
MDRHTMGALASHSIVLAVLSVVVLIGVPIVFATPGDEAHGVIPSPVQSPSSRTSLQFVAVVVWAWLVWPLWAAIVVVVLVALVAAAVSQLPRRRWLLTAQARRSLP